MSDSESQNKKTDSSKLSWIYQLHKSELLKKLQELKLPFTEESTVDQLRKILSQHYKSQADLSKFGLEKQQPLKMTTSYNLQFPAFDGEKWESFQQQLECVIQLNDIPDEKKVTLLLTKVTPKVFETLTYLCSPEKPIQLSYEELCKKLQDKYIPKQSIALDRAVFRNRNQGEAEKVEEYVLELRKLAGKCNFKDKDDQIKEKFIDGVQSRLIKFELLKSDSNMTLEETIILAKTVEAALLQSNTKQKPKEAAEEMFFYRYKDKKNGSLPNRNIRREAVNKSVTGNPKMICYCCGNDNHIKKDCRLIKKYCSECGKQGHLFKVCPKNPKVKTYLLEKDEMSTEAAEVSAEEAEGPEQKEEGSYDIYSINEVFTPHIETTALDESLDSDLPPLQFPDDDFWNVFVTVANSTLEIWLRIIGEQYSDAFEALLADMSKYYERSGSPVDKSMIIKQAWYAVNLDDGGWQRAKILEINDDTATVFLGDHGDDDLVNLNKIKILEPQFRKLPAQALLCRLEGAEELAASAHCSELVRHRLQGEVLVAAPGPRHDPADDTVAVVLYDTSTQRDLNLNKEIVHDFCISGAFTITQKPCEVEVGCVTEEGRVWVSRAGGAGLVRAALALLTAGAYRRPLPAAPQAPAPNAGTLYIVRTLAGDWVRCTIISGLDGEGTVRTQLVDSGLILRAPLSSLVPLQSFSPALNAYPYQALAVRLGPAERAAAGMVARLRALLLGARVLCRALGEAAAPPAVELFVRTGPQNILASVNNAILMEYDYLQHGKVKEDEKDNTNHVEALHKKKERIFRSLSLAGDDRGPACALPPPPLPARGRCFDVYIAMAANPWNFVVQPNSTRNTLQTMMASLQTECPKLSELDAPVNPASGELYTVYYEKDSSWYRVTVAGTVSAEMVSVYFCDYGDLALFATKELRPIPVTAPLARSLPPQAIKARLYDVWPLHQDWTVEDCIRFQELCVEQQFVGICKDVGKDPLNPNEPLLTLDLIDTSTDEDIYLNKQLVAEGRARLSSPA